MKRESIVWVVVMVVAGAWLLHRAAIRDVGMGKIYVKEVRLAPDSEDDTRTAFTETSASDSTAMISLPRSLGLWIDRKSVV